VLVVGGECGTNLMRYVDVGLVLDWWGRRGLARCKVGLVGGDWGDGDDEGVRREKKIGLVMARAVQGGKRELRYNCWLK